MRLHVLKLHPSDNVAVALSPLEAGQSVTVDGRSLPVSAPVPIGHKIALSDLSTGDEVVKYGYRIGRVTQSVVRGDWLHSHNMKTSLQETSQYTYNPERATLQPAAKCRTFDGYLRPNGCVGTRNQVWVVSTVGCVNRSADRIAQHCNAQFGDRIDGVYALQHAFGCSQLGDDLEHTRTILADLIRHPNAGGVLLLGLGCEENRVASVLDAAGDVDLTRLRYFNSQEVADEVEEGVTAVEELVDLMRHDRRVERPLSDLQVGLKCGGSDALSGITANPLVGRIVDRVSEHGGGAILTEVPEMFGAEQTLMNRAATEGIFHDIVSLVADFKAYYTDHRCPIYENPSPGNVEGGLTTLEEKSLGAIRKGGSAIVTEVLRYGERKMKKGLSLLEAPGNDAVSATALVAAGATVVLFTTGRGTPLGCPVPTIKISSNRSIYERKPRWIDFNAGSPAEGFCNASDLEADLFELLLDVAGGRKRTNNELYDYRDVAIWKMGVTL